MIVERRTRLIAAAAVAALALTALAGCTPDPQDQQHHVNPPVVVDLNDVDGTTVRVQQGSAVDLIGDEEHYTAWEAEIADPSVVTFLPGRDDGSAQYNPGLTAESEGETEVALDNPESGASVAFTVEVTAR